MKKLLLLIATMLVLIACGGEAEKDNVQKQEFSCEKSKKEIDTILEEYKDKENPAPEYWELRQIEYNQQCEKIYVVD